MAKENQKKGPATEELLRDLLIVQLGLAGLGQREIREIVGVDIHRVSRIVKHFKKLNEK
jgi:transposase